MLETIVAMLRNIVIVVGGMMTTMGKFLMVWGLPKDYLGPIGQHTSKIRNKHMFSQKIKFSCSLHFSCLSSYKKN